DLGVSHVSWYQLTIEQNTPFYSKPPTLPADERIEALQEQGVNVIEHAGLQQYEVSAFAIKGQESRHNLNYWQFGDYLAIGAGAHGKVTTDQGCYRFKRTRVPSHYLQPECMRPPELDSIPDEDLLFEIMMNGLRLKNGLPTDWVLERGALTYDTLLTRVSALMDQGLLSLTPQRVKTTPKGYRYLNKVLEGFLPT
ncbi:MAG: YggW family oxidoreductase, partial [Cellvibrionales bacterium]|nr:YggW family oxidoreductase [Cellvibrionales bacterium]